MKRKVSVTVLVVAAFSLWMGIGGVDLILDAYRHSGPGYVLVPDGPQPRPDFRTGDAGGDTRPKLVSEGDYKRHAYSRGGFGLFIAAFGAWLTVVASRHRSS